LSRGGILKQLNTLEIYIQTCRFIFLCNREGHIIEPLYSRCVKIEVNSPTPCEIKSILKDITFREKVNPEDIPDEVYSKIITGSQRDLSRAIRYLEKYLLKLRFLPDTSLKLKFDLKDYDSVYKYCHQIIDTIIGGSDIVLTMDAVRLLLYELINYCTDNKELIPILLSITLNKIPKTAHNERYLLCNMASTRDETIRQSSKSVYHVEGFCLYIFGILKSLMENKQKTVVIKKKI
jgi:DNA polymerase III delta prime subunit